jgi:integrase
MLNQAKVYLNCHTLFVDAMSFGDWLRQKIKETGLSNAEVARRAAGYAPLMSGDNEVAITDDVKIIFHGQRFTGKDKESIETAVRLIVSGIEKVVSERLGHSNINITLSTYVHILPNMQKEASARISDILSNLVRPNIKCLAAALYDGN